VFKFHLNGSSINLKYLISVCDEEQAIYFVTCLDDDSPRFRNEYPS